MTEFISRKYGNDGYEVIIKTDSHEHYKASEDFARGLIDHAKPMTVVHGRWAGYHEADIGYDEYGVRCSNCNFEVEDNEVDFIMNYCPNCGANMMDLKGE